MSAQYTYETPRNPNQKYGYRTLQQTFQYSCPSACMCAKMERSPGDIAMLNRYNPCKNPQKPVGQFAQKSVRENYGESNDSWTDWSKCNSCLDTTGWSHGPVGNQDYQFPLQNMNFHQIK